MQSTTPFPNYDHKGQKWPVQNCAEGGCYSHIMPPNTRACVYNGQSPQPGDTLVGASSNHPGGVNLGMLDGSVKFIKNTINVTTWRAISTKDKGEIIDANSY